MSTMSQRQGRPEVASSSNDTRPGARRNSSARRMEDVYDAKYAVDLATHTSNENVFLFIPNLIGYVRVITAALSLSFMSWHPKACTALYCMSCLLDAFDGMAARALNQTSKFGAVLDMVTDRCTTSCLLCFLSSAYPAYALLFQFLITLDFSSHYIHMYSSLTTGSASHKTVTSDVSRILWYYYNDATTLFLFCLGNEVFFVALYLNKFYDTPLLSHHWLATAGILHWLSKFTEQSNGATFALFHPKIAVWVGWFLKQLTWPQVLAAVTFPVCFAKNVINIVQFWKASKILVGVDLAQRADARAAQAQKAAGQGKAN